MTPEAYLESFDILTFDEYTAGLEQCYQYIKQFFDYDSLQEITNLRPLLKTEQQDLIQELEIYKTKAPVVKTDADTVMLKLLEAYGFYSKNGYFLLTDRFVVPIRNATGHLISLVGWYKDIKKYVTIPTRYFDKKLDWFNIESGMDLSLSTYGGTIIVVEGIFDALSLRAAGLPAIATMGSTVEHIKGATLKLFDKVIMFADADDVGQSAVNRWSMPENTTKVLLRLTLEIELPEIKQVKIYNEETKLYETQTQKVITKKKIHLKDPDDLVTYAPSTQWVFEVLTQIKASTNRIEYIQN